MNILVWLAIPIAILAVAALVAWKLLRSRNMEIWIGSYLRRPRVPASAGPVHVMFCIVDHFEPMWHGADEAKQRERVDRWCRDYRTLAGRHRDADGRPPQHSFFYPEEEYVPEYLDKLAALCADGFGEIEVHLHNLRRKLGADLIRNVRGVGWRVAADAP